MAEKILNQYTEDARLRNTAFVKSGNTVYADTSDYGMRLVFLTGTTVVPTDAMLIAKVGAHASVPVGTMALYKSGLTIYFCVHGNTTKWNIVAMAQAS